MRMRSSDSPVALCALYSLQPGATDSVHFVVQGTALCMGVLFVVFNLLVDAACLALDPRHAQKVAK